MTRLPPELSAALRALRQVRSGRPAEGCGPEAFAAWRLRMAGVLEALAPLLLFPEDRERAAAEARAARAEAALIIRDQGSVRSAGWNV